MKWFKHFSKARCDVRIRRLIKKHGLKGYGLYFFIVEIIAFDLETDSPWPDLEDNAKDIADFFGEDTVEIEQIIKTCLDEGLFEMNEKTGRIGCLKLLMHLDNTMSNNPEIQKILSNFKKLQETLSKKTDEPLQETSSILKQSSLDKSRLDESSKKIQCIFKHWNSLEIIVHKNLSKDIEKSISKKLKDHSEEDIKDAMNKYKTVISDKNYYFDYKWNLNVFLDRKKGFPDFTPAGEKWLNYKAQSVNDDDSRDGKKIIKDLNYDKTNQEDID